MNRAIYALVVALTPLLTTVGPGETQEDKLVIIDLMKRDEFQKCGLQKLTKSELVELDQWIQRFGATLLDKQKELESSRQKPAKNLEALEGGSIVANDGQFLGRITKSRFDSDSLVNAFGAYGSRFSSTSIFNQFGEYGSQFSSLSPFNRFSSTPPKILKDGKVVGYLTVNEMLKPRVDPSLLIGWLRSEN